MGCDFISLDIFCGYCNRNRSPRWWCWRSTYWCCMYVLIYYLKWFFCNVNKINAAMFKNDLKPANFVFILYFSVFGALWLCCYNELHFNNECDWREETEKSTKKQKTIWITHTDQWPREHWAPNRVFRCLNKIITAKPVKIVALKEIYFNCRINPKPTCQKHYR